MYCPPRERRERKKDEKQNVISSSLLQLKDKEREDMRFIRLTRTNAISGDHRASAR